MMGGAAPKFRRGFKSEATALATEVRRELGLSPRDALDPLHLALHLEIPVLPMTALRETAPDAVAHFGGVEKGAFSAVTVFQGSARLIVYNDEHAVARRTSTIAHELSHALLMHPPHTAVDLGTGCRIWHEQIENEADYLAGALLITDAAAVQIVRSKTPFALAAQTYGVSAQMVQYRVNMTGARRRAGSRSR